MLQTQLLSLFLLLHFTKATPSVAGSTVNLIENIKSTNNDSSIESSNDCKCIGYWKCEEFNKYMHITPRLRQERCSSKDYICCKFWNNKGNVKITTTTPKPEKGRVKNIATSTPSPRQFNEGCGTPRTLLNLSILTPDTEAALVIKGEFPWIINIFQRKPNVQSSYKFKGIGTLIHPKVILTARHCVESATEESLKIVASGNVTFQNIGPNETSKRKVKKIIRHPEFYSGGLYNDMALLILQKEFDYTEHQLNAICLPSSGQSFEGRRCLTVSWHVNPESVLKQLKKVDLPIVESRQCESLLRNTELGQDFTLHSSFVCAGGEAGKDTCKGDGGAPLMCLDNYKFVQQGIVSWGRRCGVLDEPGLYTDVTKFREWINSELRKENIELTANQPEL